MSYKRGLPYVYASESDSEGIVVHFWGERDESYKQMEYYKYYLNKGIMVEGIQMSMTDLDEIVIKRIGEIINEEYGTEKYKKIERMFHDKKRYDNGQKD